MTLTSLLGETLFLQVKFEIFFFCSELVFWSFHIMYMQVGLAISQD